MIACAVFEKTWLPLYPMETIRTLLCSTEHAGTTSGTNVLESLGYFMNHFGIDRWADFSRGVVNATDAAQMRAHLADGCTDCARLAGFTRNLAETCARSASTHVPESALRLARAIFPVRVQDRPRRGNRIPIELIFDSFLVPSPAGLRATWQVGWQGLYRAGDCSVDLRIEPELKSSRAAVIGQITNHVLPGVDMSNLQVCLRNGKLVVAETLSNRFGEFQMEYEEAAPLKLCINLPDSRTIQLPLRKLASDQTASHSLKTARKRTGEKR